MRELIPPHKRTVELTLEIFRQKKEFIKDLSGLNVYSKIMV